MQTAMLIVLLFLAAVVLLPIAVFAAECLAAVLPARKPKLSQGARPRVAVLVPAHNEESGIAATIADILPQLGEGDRLIVVADNCSDGTAAVARSAGAAVIERTDPERRGKGYALDFGVRHLQENSPPEVVVVIDADCRLLPGTLDVLAREAVGRGLPVQGLDLLDPPDSPRLRDRISAFAFLVKNKVRPLGLSRLGIPCLLTGTGMALPWQSVQRVSLASGHIVEDMKLAVDLAIAGHLPMFCPEGGVTGTLAAGSAALVQRRRWEHGSLLVQFTQLPRLFREAVRQRRPGLLAMALDLTVPPLSLLVIAWVVVTALTGAIWLARGPVLPLYLMIAGGACLAGAVLVAWARHARKVLPLRYLLAAPLYAAWKIPLYLGFLIRRETSWVRTPRP